MKWRTLKIIALVVLANILVFGSCTALVLNCPMPGVSYLMDLIIDNQSDQYLTVYQDGILVGSISPGENIASEASFDMGRYIIVALNAKGEIVFAKRFTHDTLIRVESPRNWMFAGKAIIPSDIPHEGVSSIDLLVENKSDMVLSIEVEEKLLGDIKPGESITQSDLPHPCLPDSKDVDYHVVAYNAEEQRIFGEVLDLSELEIIDFKTLKIVIKPFHQEITFKNKTDVVVTISVNFYTVGEIQPGKTVKVTVPLYSDLVHISVRDDQGKYVYNNTYNNAFWRFRDEKWIEIITPFGA